MKVISHLFGILPQVNYARRCRLSGWQPSRGSSFSTQRVESWLINGVLKDSGAEIADRKTCSDKRSTSVADWVSWEVLSLACY